MIRRPVASVNSIHADWRFDIEDDYVKVDSEESTVILHLWGSPAASTSMDTILASLTANGHDAGDVLSIFKGEDQREVCMLTSIQILKQWIRVLLNVWNF